MHICYRYEYISSVLLYGRGARLQQSARIYIYNIILTDRRDLLSSARTVNYKTWLRVSLSFSLSLTLMNPSITKVAWILINCFFYD